MRGYWGPGATEAFRVVVVFGPSTASVKRLGLYLYLTEYRH